VTGVVRHPFGPRLYIAGLRVHHGSAGCALGIVALAAGDPWLGLVAAALVVHDARDFPWRDRDNHSPRRSHG
jgi:hypothetical protein